MIMDSCFIVNKGWMQNENSIIIDCYFLDQYIFRNKRYVCDNYMPHRHIEGSVKSYV